MKGVYFTLACTLFSLALNAQIKVEPNGKVIAGEKGPLWNSDAAATVSVYGTGAGIYPKISFGELTKNSNGYYSGTFVGEWWDNCWGAGKRLWLHGTNGFYLTIGAKDGLCGSSASGSGDVLMLYDRSIPQSPLPIYILKPISVSGDIYASKVYSGSILLTSDERLKTDVKNIGSSLPRLQLLRGVNYQLQEKPRLNFPQMAEQAEEGETEKIPVRRQTGFLAQELEKVFPDLVETDAEGYKSIDYIGLIPVIVEALKEQQALITAQSQKIAELQSAQGEAVLLPEGSAQARMAAAQPESRLAVEETAAVNAFLYQNAPNPFNTATTIRYFLSGEAANASLYIFDMQGKLIESYPLGQPGEGSVEISASGLQPGMYLYSLLVNNQEVDTKRMVITD